MTPRKQANAPTLGERVSRALFRRIFRSLRLTAIGFGAIVFLLLIGAAAVNTGTNLLYLMMATLLAFLAMALIFCRVNLGRLRARRCLPAEVHAGQTCLFEIEIANAKRWFASYGVLAEERPQGAGAPGVTIFHAAILPKKTSRQGAPVVFPRRGWIGLDEITLISSFPFGLVEAESIRSVPERLLIYPRLVPVNPRLRRQRLDSGERESREKGQGSGLYAIRDYVAGDPARSIHWKLSAKSTTLKVREFEREEARRMRIVLDARVPADPTEEDMKDFEGAISIAASLAKQFVEAGHETSLWSPAGSIAADIGPRHLRKIMRALAEAEIEAFQNAGSSAAPPPAGNFTDAVVSDHAAPRVPDAAAAPLA